MSKKYILAVETITNSGSLSLFSEQTGEIDCYVGNKNNKMSMDIFNMIRDLTVRNSIEMNQISKIIVLNGPGNFTGLRIGFSVGKGLAKALGVPFLTIPILDMLLLHLQTTGLKCAFTSVGGGKTTYKFSAGKELVNVSTTTFTSDILTKEEIKFITIKETFESMFPQASILKFNNISVPTVSISTLMAQHFPRIINTNMQIIYT